jgi:hypothetical protein
MKPGDGRWYHHPSRRAHRQLPPKAHDVSGVRQSTGGRGARNQKKSFTFGGTEALPSMAPGSEAMPKKNALYVEEEEYSPLGVHFQTKQSAWDDSWTDWTKSQTRT